MRWHRCQYHQNTPRRPIPRASAPARNSTADTPDASTASDTDVLTTGEQCTHLANDGATANDPGDTGSGPDNLQNKPLLTTAKTVSGKLASHSDSGYEVQFFSNPSGDEGKKFIGETFVKTDSSGKVNFTFSPATAVPVGQTITATAKAINLDPSNGDTSELSAAKKVVSS